MLVFLAGALLIVAMVILLKYMQDQIRPRKFFKLFYYLIFVRKINKNED